MVSVWWRERPELNLKWETAIIHSREQDVLHVIKLLYENKDDFDGCLSGTNAQNIREEIAISKAEDLGRNQKR